MDGLNWQPLLIRMSRHLQPLKHDDVLLWQGEQALIFLRAQKQLFLNFDLSLSNALKLPATAVLLHRFCEQLQKEKIAPEALTLDTHQNFTFAALEGVELEVISTTLDGTSSTRKIPEPSLRTQAEPGFLSIHQNEQPLISAAVTFADTREADFRKCSTENTIASTTADSIERHTREDRYWRLWVLLILIVLLFSWQFSKTRKTIP